MDDVGFERDWDDPGGGSDGSSSDESIGSSSDGSGSDGHTEQARTILKEAFNRAKGGVDPHQLAARTVDTLKEVESLSSEDERKMIQTLAGLFYEALHGTGAFARVVTDREFETTASHISDAVCERIEKSKPPPSRSSGHHFFCFPRGTEVLMADGSTKPIEDVGVEDAVLSCDEHTKEQKTACVRELMRGLSENGYFRINHGLLDVTGEHPLFVKKKDGREGWAVITYSSSVPNRMPLEGGDCLYTSKGMWLPITDIIHIPTPTEVYNLKAIDPPHTFFVRGVLVHNIKETMFMAHNSGSKIGFLAHNIKMAGFMAHNGGTKE